jgi:Fe(3+) dicitrate transport protein
MMSRPTTIEIVLAVAVGFVPVAAADDPAAEPEPDETIEIVDKAPPGARAELSKEQLERDEYDDLHKVLGGIAGVYVRDEDGYGLRPNIGMRGASADRSSKITLMEDGILSGPAPYSAPAAYYVPLATRMSRIEVSKGPSAIVYGPATVGGAIDMISEPIPGKRGGYLDIAGGSNRYGKLHARAAERQRTWGVMAEYVHLQTEGFKELDGGGDTGFDKDDLGLTAKVTSDPAAEQFHSLQLRGIYGHETSNETYTGLTDADFAASSQRRYRASQLDQMNWNHVTLRADHRVDIGLRTRIETSAYRHWFHRTWGKVDGFVGMRDFYGLIAKPNAGANALYYAILTGASDSTSPEEQLILGTNDRRFVSQGIQTRLAAERTTGALVHHIDAGARIHFDRADRRRFEDGYDMVSGELVRSDRLRQRVLDTRAETTALALHAQDKVIYKRLEVTAGLRLELIDYRFADRLTAAQRDGDYAVVIPGGGIEYHITDEASVLAGIHRGFVPVAPSAAPDVRPESSVNYEAGARWRDRRITADLIGFFSDYSNLKGSCTLSSGCVETQEGQEFNGGRVHVYGVEAQVGAELPLVKRAQLSAPLSVAYTYTSSAFLHAFKSALAGWGDVEENDELPYLPAHQLTVTGGIKHPRGEVDVTVRYRGESRDVAGQGPITDDVRAEAVLTVDLSAHARIRPWAELYATVSNLLDEQVIVSRRPYGARPNPPRMIAVGYKARF